MTIARTHRTNDFLQRSQHPCRMPMVVQAQGTRIKYQLESHYMVFYRLFLANLRSDCKLGAKSLYKPRDQIFNSSFYVETCRLLMPAAPKRSGDTTDIHSVK